MKHSFGKAVTLILALMTLALMIPANSVRAVTTEDRSYGEAYQELSEEHRVAYRMIEEAVAGLAPCIEFDGIVQINYAHLEKIIRAVCVDHPQYFWFLEEGTYYYEDINKGGYIRSFEPKYILDGQRVSVGSEELRDAMYAFHSKVQQIIDGIPVNLTSEYEIALYLHDYLAEKVTYTLEGEHPSAYAALIHGEAACYGYSKAYQCLLNAAGIRARTITGDSYDGEGKLVGHAWNLVWLDGDCYYVDVTWDDFDSVTHHAYFAVPLEYMNQEHFPEKAFTLPECNHESVNYHRINQGVGTAFVQNTTSARSLASCFRKTVNPEGQTVFECEIRYMGENFLNWFERISDDLWRLLGLSYSAKGSYYTVHDVYYFQIVDPNYKQTEPAVAAISFMQDSVSLTGYGKQYILRPELVTESVWLPNLIYSSSDPSVVTVDDRGMVASVGEGTAIITASSADGTVSASVTFTVEPIPEHVHTMRLFTKKDATCLEDGHQTYYLCTGCGIRFMDENGDEQLMDLDSFVIPASGHVELSWLTRFDYHQQKCACGELITGTKQAHIDENKDLVCDVCGAGIVQEENEAENVVKKEMPKWIIPTAVALVVFAVGVTVFFVIRKKRIG